MDMGWNYVTENKYAPLQFKYPYYLMGITFNLVFYGVVYTLNYKVFAPRYLYAKKFVQYAGGFLILLILFMGIRYVLDEVLLYNLTGAHNYYIDSEEFSRRYLFDGIYYTLRACLYSSLVFLYFKTLKTRNKIHQLEIEHKKAALNVLKSQIEPHFLLNTLNSFYEELFDTQPETAEGVMKLSQLLQYVTYETQHDVLPLAKELKFLQDYIYFYKKRFEDQFAVDFQIQGDVTIQQVPSLLMIHFVENVFKHGVINNHNDPANIHIKIKDTFLEIETYNKKNTSEKYMEKGIGMNNIQKRLTLMYKDNYTMHNEETETHFKAYLKIPL